MTGFSPVIKDIEAISNKTSGLNSFTIREGTQIKITAGRITQILGMDVVRCEIQDNKTKYAYILEEDAKYILPEISEAEMIALKRVNDYPQEFSLYTGPESRSNFDITVAVFKQLAHKQMVKHSKKMGFRGRYGNQDPVTADLFEITEAGKLVTEHLNKQTADKDKKDTA